MLPSDTIYTYFNMFGCFWKRGVTDGGLWVFLFAGWVGGVRDMVVGGFVSSLLDISVKPCHP